MKTYYLSGAAVCALASFGAAGALAQDTKLAAASTIEEVTIIGIGESRQVQTISGEALSIQVPVTPPNALRIGDVWRERNFGLIQIDWSHPAPRVTVEIRDEQGTTQLSQMIDTAALTIA